MLVLTRKKSEVIHIGHDIVIKVIRTGNGSVSLGIDAPSSVRVLRGELCEIKREATPVPTVGDAQAASPPETAAVRAEEDEGSDEDSPAELEYLPALALVASDA